MKSYFDFHCHPALKQALCKPKSFTAPGKPPRDFTGWDAIEIDQNAKGGLLVEMVKKKLPPVMNSQSNLTMLNSPRYDQVVIVAVVHGFEDAFARNLIIGYKMQKASPLDQSLMVDLRKKKISYFDLLNSDYDFLIKSVTSPSGASYIALNNSSQLNGNKLCLGLSIEGGHCFKGKDFQKFEDDENWYDFVHQPPTEVEVIHYLNNFRVFKEKIRNQPQGKNHRPVFLTVTHLSAQRTATHCYGTKVQIVIGNTGLTALGSSIRFMPYGWGLSSIGEKLIYDCYVPELDEDQPMLIDIKHMSISARQQFYIVREKVLKQRNWTQLPILASHMGVTGVRLHDDAGGIAFHSSKEFNHGIHVKIDHYKRKGLKGTHFYPWSIGLYDEDIEEILGSGGLIGLSLDNRILGADLAYSEVYSKIDFDILVQSGIAVKHPGVPDPVLYDDLDQEVLQVGEEFTDDEGNPITLDFLNTTKPPANTQINYLANNLLHIIKVGRAAGFNGVSNADVWNMVCIGSDLDGIADPIDQKTGTNQYTAEYFIELENDLNIGVLELLKDDRDTNGTDVKSVYGVDPNDTVSIQNKLRAVFFDNGVNFLKKFFDNQFFK